MRTDGIPRERVFTPPTEGRAFRTRTPGFLGGTGRTRDAASLGLQAGVTGPAGARNNRGRPFANPQMRDQRVQTHSQLQGNPNAGVADLSKSIRPPTGMGPPPAPLSKSIRPPTGMGPPPAPPRTTAAQPLTRMRGVYSGR